MGAGFLVLLFLIGLVIAVVYSQKLKAKSIAEWQAAADELGLHFDGDSVIEGELDGLVVRAYSHVVGSGKSRTQVTDVTAEARPGIDAQLGRDGLMRKMFGLEDLKVGDASFDEAVRVRGDATQLMAALDATTRDEVRAATGSGWTFESGKWTRRGSGRMRHALRDNLVRAATLGRSLGAPIRDVGARLKAQVEADVNEGVRLNALEALLRTERDSRHTKAALALAKADRSSALRLVAAREAGDAVVLAELALDGNSGVAQAALELLDRDHAEHASTIVALDALHPTLAQRRSQVRREVVKMLSRIARPWGESVATTMLADDEETVRLAAAHTLGAIGSIDGAVPALVPLRDKFMGGALKDAARDAILRIQARAGNPDAGRLAVVEADDAGQLSVVEEEA